MDGVSIIGIQLERERTPEPAIRSLRFRPVKSKDSVENEIPAQRTKEKLDIIICFQENHIETISKMEINN